MGFKKFLNIVYFPWSLPLQLVLGYFFIKSLGFPLHDFSNGYFPAYAHSHSENIDFVWDVFQFNTYVWNLGYPEVLVDFYINTPFLIFFFQPFSFFQDAHLAKALFNLLGICIFLISLRMLLRVYIKKNLSKYLLLLLPVLFFVPLRNQIFFGQLYFFVFALIVLALIYIERNRSEKALLFITLAGLLKIFPAVYGVIFLVQRRYKSLFLAITFSLILILFSMIVVGFETWKFYLFKVVPNTIENQSGVGFQFNAQSLSVFLKTLLVHDDFYNPNPVFNSFIFYKILLWLFKSIVLGLSIQASIDIKKDNFALFAIWTVALLLIQDRTATYTQLLWIIPMLYIFSKPLASKYKIVVFINLLLLCNLPLKWMDSMPIFLKFGRLWLSLVFAMVFFLFLIKRNIIKTQLLTLLVVTPLCLFSILNHNQTKSDYVLNNKGYFMVYDYGFENGKLFYEALGKEGKVKEETTIQVQSFETGIIEIIDNQLFYKDKQITSEKSLKAKPILVNGKEIYFLSDYNTRRMHYTLRKINIE